MLPSSGQIGKAHTELSVFEEKALMSWKTWKGKISSDHGKLSTFTNSTSKKHNNVEM